jgi:prepilin-type N-terminal cleavage/methylation domain-containing protein
MIPGKRQYRSGFTLIELLMVVSIVALIGAIAIPKYAVAASHYRLASTLNRLVADIGATRSLAMATGKSQTITFNAAANTYTITGMTSLENPFGAYAVNLNAEPYKTDITQVNFGLSRQTVTLDAYGAPDFAGYVTVSCGGVTKSVYVDGTTGKATIP